MLGAEDGGTVRSLDELVFVDAHVHFWELGFGWYPSLTEPDADDHGMGDLAPLRRDYLPADYHADAAGIRVPKIVHVTAANAPPSWPAETAWLDQLATSSGDPAGIVGFVDPGPAAEVGRELDAHLDASPRFRGVRVLTGLPADAPSSVVYLEALAARDLVYDLVADPSTLVEQARLVASVPALDVVLEHTGWPKADDDDTYERWRTGMVALAANPKVSCKISGLAMTVQSFDPALLRRWVLGAIDIFGVERCLFATNFPVDSLFGSYTDLVGTYVKLTTDLSDAEADALFRANTERVYRL
jgi:predicted TIM-barrel fold metal-dependent hydrolase